MEPLSMAGAQGLMAGASALGSLGNIVSTAINTQAQFKLAEQNRQWYRNQWIAENEYNSPASQMQRLKAAGLNPNLLYGQVTSGNASPLRPNDPYNAKGIGDAFTKLDYQAMLTNLAKSAEEIRSLRLENEGKITDNSIKRVELQNSQVENALKGAQWEAVRQWADYTGTKTFDDYFITSPSGSTINNHYSPLFFLQKMSNDLEKVKASTSDINARKGLTELKQEFQRLINSYQITQNKWQPFMYGVDMGTKVLNSIIGGVGKFYRPPMTYNKNYNVKY